MFWNLLKIQSINYKREFAKKKRIGLNVVQVVVMFTEKLKDFIYL